MGRRYQCAGLLAMALVLAGCASVKLNAGFDDVSAVVEQRSRSRIFWHNGTELDREAVAKLRSLLDDKLTAERALQIALLNNRDLQAVYSDLGVSQADLVQAGLLKNPIFDAAVRFPVSGGRPDWDIATAMNFLDVFYVPLRQRVAAARFEETKLSVTGVVLDFSARVRAAFFTHQANEQMLELRKSILQGLVASMELARRLREAENISDLDFARERAVAEAGRLALRSAEVGVRQGREELNTLMGLWGPDTAWEIDGHLPELPREPEPTDRLEPLALTRSVDLAHARQRILVAGEQLGVNRATALIPELHLGANGERSGGYWDVGPVIEFPIPLFDQGQARVARAAAELRRAQQEYYALAVRVRSTARAVRDRLEGARDRALYYRDILLPLHERIVNEAQLHYNAMQLGPVQLLRAREQQIATGVAYVEALRDHWLARIDFEQIASGRLPRIRGVQSGRTPAQLNTNDREGH